jgi:urease subunit alpha
MLYNDSTPDIDVNPETYEVKVDGKITTTDPTTKLIFSSIIPLVLIYFKNFTFLN